MRKITEAPIDSKTKAFVRADLDVAIADGKIQDTYRLDNLIPTLQYIREKGGKFVIAGHMGRPQGAFKQNLSTLQLIDYFDSKLGANSYTLLENLRYDEREEAGNAEFAKEILGDCNMYINDSFATCHRNHSSMTFIPKLVPAYAGLRLIKEVETLTKVLENPTRPLTAIVGGAKIESKKPVISKFLQICDNVLVGGKLGLEWEDEIPNNLILPTDYGYQDKDIGADTIKTFSNIILKSKSIIWSGPVGLYEDPEYQKGTVEVANFIAFSGAFSVVGGGDTVAAINKFNMLDKFSFVSTGGSAMLELLSGSKMPGLEALN